MADQTPVVASKVVEQTRIQSRVGAFGLLDLINIANIWARQASYDVYRRMLGDPTIALARAIATMPIKRARWSFEAQKGAPDAWVSAVDDALAPHMKRFLHEVLRSWDMGFAAFEIVWELRGGLLGIAKLKPLLPDITDIMIDQRTGAAMGLRQGTALLSIGDKGVLYTYDGEGSNWYGRSRLENIRENGFKPWLDVQTRSSMYFLKAAGVIPMVSYPPGTSPGPNEGDPDISNETQAWNILMSLSSGKGVIKPWELQKWAEEAVNRGVDPKNLSSWQIDFLETKPGHGDEFLGHLRYFDSLKMRGYLVPERSGTEGQQGTKAEAETHGDLVVDMAEDELALIFETLNRQVVDPFLIANFGPDAKGKVRACPAPIVDEQREFVRSIVHDVLVNPANIDYLMGLLDVDAMLDEAELPKAQTVVDPSTIRVEPKPDPAADQNAKPASGAQRALAASLARTFGSDLAIALARLKPA